MLQGLERGRDRETTEREGERERGREGERGRQTGRRGYTNVSSSCSKARSLALSVCVLLLLRSDEDQLGYTAVEGLKDASLLPDAVLVPYWLPSRGSMGMRLNIGGRVSVILGGGSQCSRWGGREWEEFGGSLPD